MAEEMNELPELPINWQVFEDAEALAQSLTQDILAAASKAIKASGAFHFVTAGGTTPNRCYQLLSQADADWHNWHIYMGDERVLPFVNPERNSQALLQHWLSNNDIPVKQIHFINTEAGIEKSAKDYAKIIDAVEAFDFCLLGMGEDGHTASLFPGHEQTDSVKTPNGQALETASVIMEFDSPKPPAERVSLNYGVFKKCRKLVKVITGASKQDAIKTWLEQPTLLPISRCEGHETSVYISADSLP